MTRYPTISLEDCIALLRQRIEGDDAPASDVITWRGSGDDMSEDLIEDFAEDLEDELEEFRKAKDKDVVEGKIALKLLDALREVELGVLDDPGFWRYLSMHRMWGFIRWRESGKKRYSDWSKYRIYVDGRQPAECVPPRMYIRARLAHEAGDETLAHAVPEATDLWRSHIVRVRTSYSPASTRALLESQLADRLPTDPLRVHAKHVKRLRSNVVLGLYEREAVAEVLAELREDLA